MGGKMKASIEWPRRDCADTSARAAGRVTPALLANGPSQGAEIGRGSNCRGTGRQYARCDSIRRGSKVYFSLVTARKFLTEPSGT